MIHINLDDVGKQKPPLDITPLKIPQGKYTYEDYAGTEYEHLLDDLRGSYWSFANREKFRYEDLDEEEIIHEMYQTARYFYERKGVDAYMAYYRMTPSDLILEFIRFIYYYNKKSLTQLDDLPDNLHEVSHKDLVLIAEYVDDREISAGGCDTCGTTIWDSIDWSSIK